MTRKLPDWLSISTSDLPADWPNVRTCPKCGAEGRVVDSRVTRAGAIMRRRIYPKCKWLWKTVEPKEDDPLIIKEER